MIFLGEHVIVDVVFQSEFGRLFPGARAVPFRRVTIPLPLSPILHDLATVVALYARPRLLTIYPVADTGILILGVTRPPGNFWPIFQNDTLK